MKYENTKRAVFLDRPNRFIAHVDLNGQTETVHVKNTGRCKELLIPGTEVILEESVNPARKTKYDLICGDFMLSSGKYMKSKGTERKEK